MLLNININWLLLLFLFLIACNGETVDSTTQTNTSKVEYRPSELSKLMLAMYEESEQMKQQIANGETLQFKLDYKKILTAQATDPGQTFTPNYQALANTYLQQMDSLQHSNQVQLSKNYEKMIMSCISCHKAMCPGPLARIGKLQH